MTDDQDLRTEFPSSSHLNVSFKFSLLTVHWNLNPYPVLHQTTIWRRCGTTQHDKEWLKSYENIFSFSNIITCDKTDFYLRCLNQTGAFTLFISLRNLTTMVQGLTLATLSTLWKQLWCYEKFPAITITAWHVLKINKMSYINCWTLIALIMTG